MKVALSAGHHPVAQGACFANRCEHELAAEWCAIIGQMLDGYAEVFHVPTGGLRDTKVPAINAAGCDIAAEIHFNSVAGGGVKGAETLYCPGSDAGKVLAGYVQDELVLSGASFNRGIKEGYYQMDRRKGPDFFLAHTSCPAIIIEPEFIDQYHRVEMVKRSMCFGVATALVKWEREIKHG